MPRLLCDVVVLLALLAAVVLRAAPAGAQQDWETPPNIVFMLADDLGFNDASMHGAAQIPTPNIDSIAADGFELFNHYANPMCSPTRASLYTGRNAISHGAYPRPRPLLFCMLPLLLLLLLLLRSSPNLSPWN